MGISRSQFNKILNTINQKKIRNQQTFNTRKDALYEDFPEFKTIDSRIATLSMGATRKVLESPERRAEIMEKLQTEIKALSSKRVALLESNNFPPDYLTPIFDCQDCEDTGFLEGERCHCLQKEIMKFSYGQSNLTNTLSHENFDHFSLDYYSSDVPDGDTKSARDIAQRNYKTCYDFASSFGTHSNNLLLHGKAGLGKTFLCNCIAKEVLDQEFNVIYLTAFQLFRLIREYRFNYDSDLSSEDIDAIYKCDLLIIDDLGTEGSNSFTTSELFSLINDRLLNEKPVVISTNLTPNELVNHYSDRIISRVLGHYLSLKFLGSDIRLQKKFS